MISFSLDGQRHIDLGDGLVSRLLHLLGLAVDFVLADVAVLLELLEMIETVAAHVAGSDASLLGVFVRDLDQFLAALLVEFGDADAQHLAFGSRVEAEVASRGWPSQRRRPCRDPRPAR